MTCEKPCIDRALAPRDDLAAACQNLDAGGPAKGSSHALEKLEPTVPRVTDYLAQEMQLAHR